MFTIRKPKNITTLYSKSWKVDDNFWLCELLLAATGAYPIHFFIIDRDFLIIWHAFYIYLKKNLTPSHYIPAFSTDLSNRFVFMKTKLQLHILNDILISRTVKEYARESFNRKNVCYCLVIGVDEREKSILNCKL